MGTHTMRVVKRVCRQEPWQLGTNCQGSNAPWGIAGFNPPAQPAQCHRIPVFRVSVNRERRIGTHTTRAMSVARQPRPTAVHQVGGHLKCLHPKPEIWRQRDTDGHALDEAGEAGVLLQACRPLQQYHMETMII